MGFPAVLRRAWASSAVVVGVLALSASPAIAEHSTYTTTVTVKKWTNDARREAAQKAANKGCRADDRIRAKIKVRMGARHATYRFDCVAGAALAT
jgi:hypothetical protein